VLGDPLNESKWEVSAATRADSDSIASIAAVALTTSRFHLDPGIPSATASFVKSEWARNLALGRRGNGCRVIRRADGVRGFLGVVEGKGDEMVLTIDLIAVRPEAQGQGIGAALVRDFLEIAHAHGALAQVGTQVANTAAVRFYERLGFTLTNAEYVMHAHVPTKDPS
jgi:ribosomal protein S18 acetylase RimI-like enzyme